MVVSKAGISIVSNNNQSGKVQTQHFEHEKWQEVKHWIENLQPLSNRVHLVLDNKQYQLHQIEPPKVPEQDLNQALLFSLRDRLEHPITEMQLDHFEFPDDAQRGGEQKVNVVTSHTLPLKKLRIDLESSGLELAKIGIAELALGNMLNHHASMSKGICFLAYRENSVTFVIYKNSQFYLSRRVTINSWDDCINPEIEFARESLLLEIQRTLDYYQSQMVQPPVTELIIPDWGDAVDVLVEYLKENLSIVVNQISSRDPTEQSHSGFELRHLMLAKAALLEDYNNAEG